MLGCRVLCKREGVGMEDIQVLTHDAPKQQLMSPLHSWLSVVPYHTSLSPSPGQGSQRVGTGWTRLRMEWGNSLRV